VSPPQDICGVTQFTDFGLVQWLRVITLCELFQELTFSYDPFFCLLGVFDHQTDPRILDEALGSVITRGEASKNSEGEEGHDE